MAQPRFRRKQFIVKKGMQYRYIGLIFALVLAVVAVTGATLFYTAWTMFGEKLANVYPQGRLVVIFRQINFILIRNLILFVFPVILVLAVRFSHKIAGPMIRIERTLKELAACNFDIHIKLRKGDEFTDVADLINEIATSLKKERDGLRGTTAALNRDIEELEALAKNPSPSKSDLAKLLSRIKDDSKKLDEQFKAPPQPQKATQPQPQAETQKA